MRACAERASAPYGQGRAKSLARAHICQGMSVTAYHATLRARLAEIGELVII